MLRKIFLLCCVTNCFASTPLTQSTYLPPPPKDTYGVACDKTGTICTGVGYRFGDNEKDCDWGACVIPIAYYTSDAGKTWHESKRVSRRMSGADTYQHMLAVACDKTGTECAAVGKGNYSYRYNSEPLTYVSHDAGRTWLLSKKQLGILPRSESCIFRFWDDSLEAVSCDKKLNYCVSIGYAGCSGGSRHDFWNFPLVGLSQDGGNTWQFAKEQPKEPAGASYTKLNQVKCNFDKRQCIAIGFFGNDVRGQDATPLKYVSNDLGETWSRVVNKVGEATNASAQNNTAQTLNDGPYDPIYVRSWSGTSKDCDGQKCTIPVAFHIEKNIYHRVHISKRFHGAHTYHKISDYRCYEKHCLVVGGAKEFRAHYIPLSYVSEDYGITWNLSATQPESVEKKDSDVTDLSCNPSGKICYAFHKEENTITAKWMTQDGGNTWVKLRLPRRMYKDNF